MGDPWWRATLVSESEIPLWSIGDALDFLKPPIPRRTLARRLARIEPVGLRASPQGGPDVRVYRATDVIKIHANWWAKNFAQYVD